jgi:threonine/homoserine/homoserine lactone efflux protein
MPVQVLFAEFLTAAIVMEVTPGPNMTWLALLSAREGRAAGLMAVAGIAAGLSLLAVIAATGAAALIDAWPALYDILRWGGVLFLLYLAWEAWVGEKPGAARDDKGRHFWRGLIANLLNPKAVAVFVVMIPGFAGPANAAAQITMTLTYLGIATLAHVLIVAFAGSFEKALADPRRERLVRRTFALALVGVAVWFAAGSGRTI